MAKNDGKNNFYRLLELDEETKKILKWYRSNFEDIKNLDNKEKEDE